MLLFQLFIAGWLAGLLALNFFVQSYFNEFSFHRNPYQLNTLRLNDYGRFWVFWYHYQTILFWCFRVVRCCSNLKRMYFFWRKFYSIFRNKSIIQTLHENSLLNTRSVNIILINNGKSSNMNLFLLILNLLWKNLFALISRVPA